mmetsp:Transcript_4120/g.8506  ORF Transcript_4120/g.8506 Transcript_4120/m.8506 type:complete len:239 (-) Transcript_4120:137-853(-)
MVVTPSAKTTSSTTASVSTAVASAKTTSSTAASSVTSSTPAKTSAPSTATFFTAATGTLLVVVISRHVDAFRGDLEIPSLEFRSIQLDGILDRGLRLKLQVSETLGFSRVFITNNRHPLDRPAGLKVPQELFGRRAVIHLPHINRCPVAVFRGNPTGGLSVAAVVVGITVGVVSPTLLFLFQIVRFLGDSSGFRLHALDFFLEFFEVFLVVFLRNRFRCFFRGFFAHCSLVFLQYVSG